MEVYFFFEFFWKERVPDSINNGYDIANNAWNNLFYSLSGTDGSFYNFEYFI